MGDNDSRLKRIYHNMKVRCYNEHSDVYRWYGAKGIGLCDEWRKSFKTFEEWALNNGYDDNLTLDRIDSTKNYCPDNCRWATRKEQANNTQGNRLVTYNGKTQTIAQWAEETGISYTALSQRLRAGWTIEDSLTKPNQETNKPSYVTYNGKTQRICDWAKELGISYSTLQSRIIQRKMPLDKAFAPVERRKTKNV